MEHIFVYDQFRDSANLLLGDTIYCGKASISGKIYKVNEFYPGWVPGEGKVLGDVYLIDPNLFPKLDEFKGDEYIRVKVRASTDIECWVYQYKNEVSGFKEIIGGDWILR